MVENEDGYFSAFSLNVASLFVDALYGFFCNFGNDGHYYDLDQTGEKTRHKKFLLVMLVAVVTTNREPCERAVLFERLPNHADKSTQIFLGGQYFSFFTCLKNV
jgi:hypothetical protein